MSRFGFKATPCKRPDIKLECIGKVYVDAQSCVFYTGYHAHAEVYIFNLSNNRWYKMRYTSFEEQKKKGEN
jgi:hypothetical protein